MRARVTDSGVIIPKDWLGGAQEVEVRREERRIVVEPVVEPFGEGDPIHLLGSEPIRLGITDASVKLDEYLYGEPS